tara:strand:- start:2318 stop:3319 length:1002 start_codon:yes stop_codon:yes gene_type:complete
MTNKENDLSLANAIRSGDRSALAKGITLTESTLIEDRNKADKLLLEILPFAGKSHRIGITGLPGSGKSTLIEQLGVKALDLGYKVAVLAIDPSSEKSGGSILGDKTRMTSLAIHPDAFIRPSPSGSSRTGIGNRTRECMYLCEAAGFNFVLVETVGVGQVELEVSEICDIVLLLLLPGSGDELQGMKRGSTESADIILVNKADGLTKSAATTTASDYQNALNLVSGLRNREVDVMPISALENQGTAEVLSKIIGLHQRKHSTGEIQTLRSKQCRSWLWHSIKEIIEESMLGEVSMLDIILQLEKDIILSRSTGRIAAKRFVDQYLQSLREYKK